jgi:hypothetical protein
MEARRASNNGREESADPLGDKGIPAQPNDKKQNNIKQTNFFREKTPCGKKG